jgi:hypothetical protein
LRFGFLSLYGNIVSKIEMVLEIEEVIKKFRVKGSTEKVSNSLI